MNVKKLLFLSFLVLFFLQVNAQEEPNNIPQDSIDTLSNSALIKKFYTHIDNQSIAEKYANAYIKRSKKFNNPIYTAKSYELMVFLYQDTTKIIYLDSIIDLTSSLKDSIYPATSYNQKGKYFYIKGFYNEALDNYLKADKLASNYKNLELLYDTKHSIGILKGEIGERQEALINFKDVYNYYKSAKNISNHLTAMRSLANSYTYNKQLDSASFLNIEGYKKSIKYNTNDFHFFSLNEGINQFYKKNYKQAKDSIIKVLSFITSQEQIDIVLYAYTYLGKAYENLNSPTDAIKYYTKADSLFTQTRVAIPKVTDGYKYLIDYFKSHNNQEKQLYFINQLLVIDTILDERYRSLNKKISKNYEIPKLIFNQETIIKNLQNDNRKYSKNFLILIVAFIILIFLLIYYYYKQFIYKKRFKILIDTSVPNSLSQIATDSTKFEDSSIGIAKETVESILKKLEKFEENKGYLKNNVSLNSLAKQMKTNSNYLSRIINFYMKKSFKSYINEIRVDYVIDTLKKDSKLRSYTVEAIADELGFNNPESFSNAFYKKTGIYPSYYIRKLKKAAS